MTVLAARVAAVAVAIAAFSTIVSAQAASADSQPDRTNAWSWRGEGTGIFRGADPPIHWQRISATMKGLTAQADKPRAGAAKGAQPMDLGHIPEWAIIGPFEAKDDAAKPLDKEFIPGEADLQPAVGDKVGELVWKKVASEGELLDATRHFTGLTGKVVYAHAYVHSPAGATLNIRLLALRCKIWLNGKVIYTHDGRTAHHNDTITLNAGWNRLLVKMAGSPAQDGWDWVMEGAAAVRLVFWGGGTSEKYDTRGILWSVQVPQAGIHFSCAQPLAVGDRVFVNSDPEFLVCYNKNDGKRLWISYNGFSEFATAQERADHADLFGQIDPKAKRLKELAAAYTGAAGEKKEMNALVADLDKLMAKVDPRRYNSVAHRQEAGRAGLTSCSDGKFIYTWYACGAAVCHDLDGNRKWMTLENEGSRSGEGAGADMHGMKISPMLAGDELIISMRSMMGLDKATGKLKWKIAYPLPGRDWYGLRLKEFEAGSTGEGTDTIAWPTQGIYKPGLGFVPWCRMTRVGDTLYDSFDTLTGDPHKTSNTIVYIYTVPDVITNQTRLTPKRVTDRGAGADMSLAAPGINKFVANSLVHDGLIYTITTNAVLYVIDATTLKSVYTARLGLNTITHAYPYPHGSGVCASPTLAGDYVYLTGNGGSTIIIKAGRKFEVVAANRIECILPGRHEGTGINQALEGWRPECTVSCPVFEGTRMFYRAEEHLYCIGKR
ncbi:MAG: hypothetical protein ACE15C_11700 [Phycisphaerae bacterium]